MGGGEAGGLACQSLGWFAAVRGYRMMSATDWLQSPSPCFVTGR